MKIAKMTAVIAVATGFYLPAATGFSQTADADVSVGGTGADAGVDASVGGGTGADVGVDATVGGGSGADAGVDASVGGGTGADAGVDASVGGGSGADAGVDASVGGGTGADAGVDASVGGGTGADAGVDASVGAGTGADAGANAGVGAGGGTTAADVTADTESVDASLNLDVSGLAADARLRALDVNGDGQVNVTDDLNGDGTIDGADVQLAAGGAANTAAGGTAATTTAATSAGGNAPERSNALRQLAAMDPADVTGALGQISESDVLVLKKECQSILADEKAAEPRLVAVCKIVAALKD